MKMLMEVQENVNEAGCDVKRQGLKAEEQYGGSNEMFGKEGRFVYAS